MIRGILSLYLPSYPKTIVYMLQSTEYQTKPYLKWYWRTNNFSSVAHRRQLTLTRPARMLLMALRLAIILEILAGLSLIGLGLWDNLAGGVAFGAAVILVYPVLWGHLVLVVLAFGRWFVSGPSAQKAISASEQTFAEHKAIRIAVAGSYGKTTMKELLNTVLSQGLSVAATPANKNVSISHANFAKLLNGKEQVLIIEYGEGAPGDVGRFAKLTHPTHAVITGLAPAHLDRYKTLQAAGQDIFSLGDYLKGQNVYVNDESDSVKPFLKDSYELFDSSGALGWKTANIKVSLGGTDFTLKKGRQSLKLHSGLVGRHEVGYLAFTAALALKLGLTKAQVTAGIAATKPFEHRMQPYRLAGAWVIDDTYNGNLEGIRAGTKLLSELEAKRKIYVTPGLVDQGEENQAVHKEIGRLIAEAHPDMAVIMQNSVTDYIKEGLEANNFKGELRIEDDPLDFYTNLVHFVATGDLVLMQNDWPDNYA